MKPVKLSKHLLSDVRALIADARQDVARRVNSALVILYWKVGKRVRQDFLKEKRAGYGEEIVSTLSRQLVEERPMYLGTGIDILIMVEFDYNTRLRGGVI